MKQRMAFAMVVAALTLNGGIVMASETNCAEESRYSEISGDELAGLVAKKAVFVVDVNGADSFKEAKVPGAVNFAAVKDGFAKVLPKQKDALIVAYCGGPQCTAWQKAAKAACDLGYTNIRHYKDGIKGWKERSAKS